MRSGWHYWLQGSQGRPRRYAGARLSTLQAARHAAGGEQTIPLGELPSLSDGLASQPGSLSTSSEVDMRVTTRQGKSGTIRIIEYDKDPHMCREIDERDETALAPDWDETPVPWTNNGEPVKLPAVSADTVYESLQGQMEYLQSLTAQIEINKNAVTTSQNELGRLHRVRRDVQDDVRRLAKQLHAILDGERGI